MGVYGGLQGGIGSTLQNFMQNPLTSSFFNQRVGMGAKQISQQAAAGTQALLSNFRQSGMSGGTTNPFLQSMIARQGRATSGLQANNFLSQLFNANQLQLGATGMAQAYNPLMTGGSSTQTKSGLGTWLPQLAGAALGGLTGGLGSSLGGLFGGGGGLSSPGGSFGSGVAPSLGSVGAFPQMPNVMGGFNPMAGLQPPPPTWMNPSPFGTGG